LADYKVNKNSEIYIAEHRGLVDSTIMRQLKKQGYIYTKKLNG